MSKIKLRDYQKAAFNYALAHPQSALFAKPGTGKTLTMLCVLNEARRMGECFRVLIVAPKAVCELVWPQEIEKWGFDFSVAYMHGSKKRKALTGDQFITLTTPDTLSRMSVEFKDGLPWDTLIIDESSLYKDPRRNRFKTLRRMLLPPRGREEQFSIPQRRHILTGTPMPNHLLELWSQLFIVDFGKTLGRSFYQYRGRFFYPTGYGGYTWVPYEGAEETVFRLLRDAGKAFVVERSALSELPTLTVADVQVQLGSVMNEYRQLERDYLLEMEAGNVTAVNAAVLAGRLKEFAGGAIYDEEGGWQRIHNAKLKALIQLIEERQGAPLLVFYEFRHELERLREALAAYRVGVLLENGKPSKLTLEKWKAGELDVLLLHPKSGGHGLNLQLADADLCWFTLPWSGELYEQGNSRLHRQGQETPVIVYRLMAEHTIDYDVAARLAMKERQQQSLFDYLKGRLRERVSS